ncbi:hypothetical protein PUW23_23545 [Paenibacillus urinalis]|uniref:DUF5668 domain-containing protein n=1 Tax=Paenibacillus urinalis TaxID=521520 RepID=A0AAX3MZX9_9BACL|nr:hypothetical protein [Paenibacillus urinalis]WDH82384.1 hypothetical protein PUW23_23545 [Paenibacillus urinalis]
MSIKNKASLFAPLFIIVGVFLLLNSGKHLGTGSIFAYFWPSFFIIPLGIFFHWLYFSLIGRGIGLLVPGGILLVAGLTCQIAIVTDSWITMWPGFILAVAAGLFELYWFGGRNKYLLIPINILTALSFVFFIAFSLGSMLNQFSVIQPFIALILIVGGVLVLFRRKKKPHFY